MSPQLASDLAGAAVLSAVFLGFLAAAELWRRFGQPRPEWTRKLVHVGGGLSCLLFPFLVESRWIVLGLALALTALFAAAARLGLLRSLHGVERRSRGAEYYPLAVFLVLVLAGERTWLYVAAVLVLAVADGFAALVGSRYGVVRYGVEDGGRKSLEGSLVFFLLAFLAIHLPTLLMSDLPRPITVLAAVLVALLVTGFEAISLEGSDNLFVPLATAVVLGKITTKPLSEVTFQVLSLVAICVLVALLVRRMPYFNVGGTVVIILYAYGNWSLASWYWALPVFVCLAAYLAVWRLAATRLGKPPRIRVRRVARALLAPFAVLVAANALQRYGLLFAPYLAATAAVLAFGLLDPLARLRGSAAGGRRLPGPALAGVLGAATAVLPAWLARPAAPPAAAAAITALVVAATALCWRLERGEERGPAEDWTASRFALSLAVAAAVLGLERLGVIGRWSPP